MSLLDANGNFHFYKTDTKEKKMKGIILIALFCITCKASSSSRSSELIRVKRWENGDMGTGDMSNMFRGTAGVDYPDYKTIPNTNFRCEDQTYEGGLYADVDTNCQVYHVCHDGRKDSFLCGRGTIFNQQILACDYWYSAECDTAPNYYYLNSQIGNSVSPNKLQDNYSQYGGNPGNRQGTPNAAGNVHYYNGNGQQQSCQCHKIGNKRPWSFPAGIMQGSDK